MASNLKLLLFLVSFCRTTFAVDEVEKRLLLGDQTDSNQLISLQREMQTLKSKIAEIDIYQSQIQLLTAQISQLRQENNALKLQGSSGILQLAAHCKEIIYVWDVKRDFGYLHLQKAYFFGFFKGSTSFPIWGRKSCPAINGTETVYKGTPDSICLCP